MDRTEKETDGHYADDDKDDHEVEGSKKSFELTKSQKIYQLAAKIRRFAESIENGPTLQSVWKKLRKTQIK